MGRRALVGTFATLGVVAFVGLFASLSLLISSPSSIYAQGTNNAPVFPPADANEDYTREVAENTAWFELIDDPVTATDADDDKLIYSLENARTSKFTIHIRTGQLQVGAPLDYEDPDDRTHTVKVTATDPSGDSATITVIINVSNVDEDGKVSLTWKRPQVGFEVGASLTDPDGATSGETWQWEKLSSGSWAAISGETSATYTPVGDDEGKYIRAVATYTDPLDSNQEASSGRAYVETPPNPNYPPVFNVRPGGGYDCDDYQDETAEICLRVPRNSPISKDIYYPAWIDTHSEGTDRDQVRYSLSGLDEDLFHMDPLSRELYITKAHGYNGKDRFEITITATDPSGQSGQSGQSDTVTVALRPSGQWNYPTVKGPVEIEYPENGTWPLATYSATAPSSASSTNPDRIINGWIIGVEPGGGDGDFFRINNEGMLLFEQPPDYEEPADEDGRNTYSFSITSYDSNPPNGGQPGKSFHRVTVTVVNVEETLEISGPSVVNHLENSREVATYTVPEANGPVTWSVSGTDGQWFSINGGVLTFDSPPDYEDKKDLDGGGDKGDQPDNAYLVAITVEDNTNIKTEHVRVQVTNVNEPPAFDDDLETTITVEPDIGPNQQIGHPYTATDPDKGADLAYSLSTNTLPFSIDSYNGQLSTVDPLPQFDRTSYTVTVLVTDNADDEGNSDTTADDTITVTITVGDGGGNTDPEFPAAAVSFSIDENITTIENVGTPVTADDDDTDDTPSYTLGGTDGGFFTIVSTSGQIQTKTGQTYDFETNPSYSVTVTANDGKGGTADKAVTITLTNVNEDGTVTLSPTQPAARSQVTATLTDPDGVTGTTTWQWSKSSTAQGTYANISGATSDTYTPVDGDVTYYLRATGSYTDGHGPSKTAEATTTRAVQVGTNRAPDFGATSTTRDVAENTLADQAVGAAVTANDPDTGRHANLLPDRRGFESLYH